MADFTTWEKVQEAWRPLSTAQQTSATYWIGRISRRIRWRWPDIDDRITADPKLGALVEDVVVDLTIEAIGGPKVPGVRSYSRSSGQEQESYTVGTTTSGDRISFTDWMIEILSGAPPASPAPSYRMPRPSRYDHLFPQAPEVYDR